MLGLLLQLCSGKPFIWMIKSIWQIRMEQLLCVGDFAGYSDRTDTGLSEIHLPLGSLDSIRNQWWKMKSRLPGMPHLAENIRFVRDQRQKSLHPPTDMLVDAFPSTSLVTTGVLMLPHIPLKCHNTCIISWGDAGIYQKQGHRWKRPESLDSSDLCSLTATASVSPCSREMISFSCSFPRMPSSAGAAGRGTVWGFTGVRGPLPRVGEVPWLRALPVQAIAEWEALRENETAKEECSLG